MADNDLPDTPVVLTSASDSGASVRDLKREIKALNNKVTELDIQIFEMRALLQSGKGLSNILVLSQLLDTFMTVVRERYGVVNSCVLLRDEIDTERSWYQVKRFYGLDTYFQDHKNRQEPLMTFRIEQDTGLLWQIVLQGNVFSVRNKLKEPRFKVAWEKWNLDVLRSDFWVPLIKRGEILGILTLGERTDGSHVPDSEFSFVQELAAIATTIIDSTLKYEKNQRILTNIQTLYDVNQQLANVNDFKTLTRKTIENTVKAVKAQRGNLMLVNKAIDKLELKVMWGQLIDQNVIDGVNSGSIDTKSFDIGEGIAGTAILEKRPIIINDKDKIEQTGQSQVLCICCIPVIHSGQVEGVINITNKVTTDEQGHLIVDPLGRFSQEDISLLQGLADQAALSLNRARLFNASITDRLTGLFNTRFFDDFYSAEVANSVKEGTPLCIAVIDIDHFKKFNDTHGHKAGDLVLKTVASLLEKFRRVETTDQAFRYGGEEFVMVMPQTELEDAALNMEMFRNAIEENSVEYNGVPLSVTVSIGIATSTKDSSDAKELFNMADESLYASKENGRNQVRVYRKGAKSALPSQLKSLALKESKKESPSRDAA